MKYYVIYKEFYEGTLGEGFWETDYQTFGSLRAAQRWIEELEGDDEYKIITAPLVLAKS